MTIGSGVPLRDDVSQDARRRLLIISQNAPYSGLVDQTHAQRNWSVDVFPNFEDAQDHALTHGPRVGLVDFKLLENKTLMERWDEFCMSHPGIKWIAILPQGTECNDETRRLIWQRCYDFHTLPLDVSRLLVTIGHAYGMAKLEAHRSISPTKRGNGNGIVGESSTMRDFYRKLGKIELVDTPVLISGESGTGKELAALAIHERSHRSDGPFVAVNCGSIPSTLIQSELFGYEKGAFTGASHRKMGKIEAAAGGTVFLDEIGDLPLELQINLLRFLQENTIERVGSHKSISVDARVIAATHVDLEEAIREKRFREDLYYRLNVIHIEVPPLRKRGTDISLLAKYFFQVFSKEKGPSVRGISQGAMDAMYRYNWPGNVRELMNRMRHALVMSDSTLITPADLRLNGIDSSTSVMPLDKVRSLAEKNAVAQALKETGYKISLAARQLGISRATLYRLMTKYQLHGE
jgi:DNA-binding NtrC family response regulator